ncbi:hypothetical protein KAR29_07570 [Aminithiophilus ramosus]|uniref:Uncharacterized protein n=2 Tax=Synergistales TaxID=649776 RepID=A0A9Q7AAM9_9BACT|nr:hypothetical protein [Aminithiophilus ramosus]QTX31259.1 hypothetical protein KAR29_07570 [Aminithiophilus ramosus]QVL35059.1 hypothetical protein KIH16_07415 [Synergistota bacterium]
MIDVNGGGVRSHAKKRKGMREGFALPLALAALLVGGTFVAVSVHLVDTFVSVSTSACLSDELFNAAQDGLERGKAYLLERGPVSDDLSLSFSDGSLSIVVSILPAAVVSPDRPHIPPKGGGAVFPSGAFSAVIEPEVLESLGNAFGGLTTRNYLIRSRARRGERSRIVEILLEVTR